MSSGHLFVKIINIISWWPKAQTYLENIQKCESWFSLGDNTVDNPWVFSFIFYGCPGFFFLHLLYIISILRKQNIKAMGWEPQEREKWNCDDSGVIIIEQGKAGEASCLAGLVCIKKRVYCPTKCNFFC